MRESATAYLRKKTSHFVHYYQNGDRSAAGESSMLTMVFPEPLPNEPEEKAPLMRKRLQRHFNLNRHFYIVH